MIKHIVAFKMNETDKADNLQRLKSELDHLPTKIPDIVSYETGINISSRSSAYDLILVSVFQDLDALDSYRNHPEHLKVTGHIKQIVSDTIVVDYEVQ